MKYQNNAGYIKIFTSVIFLTFLFTNVCADIKTVIKDSNNYENVNDSINNKLSIGLGITNHGMPAGGIAFKLAAFKNFYFGLQIDIFGATVNNNANTTGIILISIVPEYQFLKIEDKIGFNATTGIGFIVSMEPLYCITPCIGIEYDINSKLAIEFDTKYLITKNKSGKDINGNIIFKLGLNLSL